MGLTSPDINTIMELADIFNITVDELVGKKKKETVYLPTEERKDINKMMFRIKVDTEDGTRVNINLPMAAVKVIYRTAIYLQLRSQIIYR